MRVLYAAAAVCGLSACPAEQSPPAPTASATATASAATTAVATASAAARCEPGCHSIERCEAGRCVPACPSGEVYVPATGPEGFVMGGLGDGAMDRAHPVILSKPFCMDATEVTVKAYRACVEAGKCEAPRKWGQWINYPDLAEHPVNKVHFAQAQSYCAFRDMSLPTEAQWEWAATGGDGRAWPWGNDTPTCEHADFTPGDLRGPASNDGCHGGGTSPVATHPKGDRIWPSGRIHDLAGNVWEWCLDNLRPYSGITETDPLHMDRVEDVHVNRGGGWNRSHVGIRAQFRGGSVADYQVPALGFRCVRNPAVTP